MLAGGLASQAEKSPRTAWIAGKKPWDENARMPAKWTLALSILILSCEACSFLPRGRPERTDTPAVRDLTPVREMLEAADADSAHLLLTEIGRVAAPGWAAPIWRAAYRPFQADLKQVLILAGAHGNEAAAVEVVLTLIQRLGSASGSTARYDMDIIPIANPWGWVHDGPFTPAGIDIAYDFTRFDSHEARIIRRFLREKRYDLVLVLREDPHATGFYLRRYALDAVDGSTRMVDRMRKAGYPMESDSGWNLFKPQNGMVDVPLWGLTYLRLTRQLTVGGYLRRNVGSVVFTVVTPANLPLADRIAMQRMAVEGLLAEYAAPRNHPEPNSN
jgi:hypothetical protein